MKKVGGAFLQALFAYVLLSVTEATVPVKTKTITNIGGSGTYDEVVGMPCGAGGGACMKKSKWVDGCLAPFDEEQALKFRGPMNVKNIAVYYPSGDSWNRVSSFTQNGGQENMAFMGNYGRSMDGHSVDEEMCYAGPGEQAKYVTNGDDFSCHGFNLTYASADGRCARKSPEGFTGWLDDNVEVAILQEAKCQGAACGFYRGVAHHGWNGVNGGAKMFATKVSYPHGDVYDSPALWFMHASVVRTASYHHNLCNCRGVGYSGGCGELDVAEIVTEKNTKMEVETSIYSYKGAISDGGGYRFERPMEDVVYVTIFNPDGYIQIVELDDFDFGASVSGARVQEWNDRRDLILSMPGPVRKDCRAPKCTFPPFNEGFAARMQSGVHCEEPNLNHY